MPAKIYRPAKTAMQSGRAKSKMWVLEYEPELPRAVEPLMGYTASSDMRHQVRLRFSSREEAVAYAKRNGIAYAVMEPHERTARPMSYAENFRFDRPEIWTH
jgi:hypothetical protein